MLTFHFIFIFRLKIGSFHKAKNRNFPKGLTHDLGQKNSKKFVFAFSQNTLKKQFLYVINKTETFLDRKNGIFSWGQKSEFSNGANPWFWLKKI